MFSVMLNNPEKVMWQTDRSYPVSREAQKLHQSDDSGWQQRQHLEEGEEGLVNISCNSNI